MSEETYIKEGPKERLLYEVLALINSDREGDYWDFKQKHHENKADLLHDILCMANSLAKRDKYIIFGVSDPPNAKVVGLVNDPNKKTQANMIDFLRSKSFIGGNKPEIELVRLNVSGQAVDVLTIFNKPEKPYYITLDYSGNGTPVRANNIYTRVTDVNTPKDQGADIAKIEQMWRERFGLDLPPGERMLKLLIKPEEWDKDIGNKSTAYHRHSPEYQIEFGEPAAHNPVYGYFYDNETSFIGTATFKYQSTELFKLNYIYCDEMRVPLAEPSGGFIREGKRVICYQYYEIESRAGAFLRFMTGNFDCSEGRSMDAPLIMFRDQSEREAFELYVKENPEKMDAIDDDGWGAWIRKKFERDNPLTFIHYPPEETIKLDLLFKQWRLSRCQV